MTCPCHPKSGWGKIAPTLNAKRKRKLLRVDPTGTLLLQKAFAHELMGRFLKLRISVHLFVSLQDSFALYAPPSLFSIKEALEDPNPIKIAPRANSVRNSAPINPLQTRRFELLDDTGKLEAFSKWFGEESERILFEPKGWMEKYIRGAYERGQVNVLRQSAPKMSEMVSNAGMNPFEIAKGFSSKKDKQIKFQTAKTEASVRGLKASVASQIERIVLEGLDKGWSEKKMARELNAKIKGMTKERAKLIAQTEIVAAFAEGQLDQFEELGILEVGLRAEWVTTGDNVCPACQAKAGKVYPIKKARGLIPLHPRCKCVWMPVRRKLDNRRK